MAQHAFHHWNDPVDLFLNGHRSSFSWPCGFPADVDDICPLLEHSQGVLDPGRRRTESAAIRERVRCGIQHSHDYSPLAKREGPGAQLPVATGAQAKGHLCHSIEVHSAKACIRFSPTSVCCY